MDSRQVQRFLDFIQKYEREVRSKYQLTLRNLIDGLSIYDDEGYGDAPINISDQCYSYRGYYSDLAFAPGNSTIADVLKSARLALDSPFDGYKGGIFFMDKDTPLWIAEYGVASEIAMTGVRYDPALNKAIIAFKVVPAV